MPSFYRGFASLLRKYNWTNLFILIDGDTPPLYYVMAKEFLQQKRQNITVVESAFVDSQNLSSFDELLDRFSLGSRGNLVRFVILA